MNKPPVVAQPLRAARPGRPEGLRYGEFLTLFRRGQDSIALEPAVGFDASRLAHGKKVDDADIIDALRQEGGHGPIETGKLADVIVVTGNPLQNMAAMTRVAYVIKGGVRYK